MDPENRVLLQVTIDDAVEADRQFSMLMGEDVAPRKDFIAANAKYVKNLDVQESYRIWQLNQIIDINIIGIIIFFDTRLINMATKKIASRDKFVISGIIGMLVFQQVQNIGMTIGLLPITGITLPFISYGGSSLLSYLILVGIILNISNEKEREYNV